MPELTWRVALLGAVIAADLGMFISLVVKELRDVRASSGTAAGSVVAPPTKHRVSSDLPDAVR